MQQDFHEVEIKRSVRERTLNWKSDLKQRKKPVLESTDYQDSNVKTNLMSLAA